jgi:galactokinase
MDQLASMLCEEHSLLYLDCRSLQTRLVPFDPSAEGLSCS